MKLHHYTSRIASSSKQLVHAHQQRVANAGGTGVDAAWLEKCVTKFNKLGVLDNLRVAVSPRFGYDAVADKATKLYNVVKGDAFPPFESRQGTIQANPVKGYTQLSGTAMGYFGKTPQPIRNNRITIYQVFQSTAVAYVGLFGLLWDDNDTDATGEYVMAMDKRNLQNSKYWTASRGATNSFTMEGKVVPFTVLDGSTGLCVLCVKTGATSTYFRNLAGSAESEPNLDLYNAEFQNYGLFSRAKASFSLSGRMMDTFVFHGVHNTYLENQIYDMLLTEYSNT
ncbi:hypothetical protein OB13_10825 [Pontibacter sp. HJ8]